MPNYILACIPLWQAEYTAPFISSFFLITIELKEVLLWEFVIHKCIVEYVYVLNTVGSLFEYHPKFFDKDHSTVLTLTRDQVNETWVISSIPISHFLPDIESPFICQRKPNIGEKTTILPNRKRKNCRATFATQCVALSLTSHSERTSSD